MNKNASLTDDTGAQSRPWWMTAMAIGCMLTVVVTMIGDFFSEGARDTEVWFGFEVTGRAARLTAPLHWAFFAVCAWAFWARKPWIVRVAAAYAFYAALSHLVWSEVSENGRGWSIGLVQAAAISSVGFILLRAGRSVPRDCPPVL
ncbi:MAG: hypothetical protein E4H03_03600 [Myxococcales bacterium]|nr:MAG: hypothetical protein E4H03_03600 [Myxococcales bacterium]